jgi:PTH1 family peptidyl-tRNA hydrolase
VTSNGIQLIVGLANPGAQYAGTRHNAGAWYISALAHEHQATLKLDKKLKSTLGKIQQPSACYLAVPTEFMNLSGSSVQALMHYYKCKAANVLIAHDDIDLPAGSIKLKFDGGHGGHNGLRDIFQKIGTPAFWRLRIGVGHPGNKNDVTNYVLRAPKKNEAEDINASINDATHMTADIIAGKFEHAMQRLHTATKI